MNESFWLQPHHLLATKFRGRECFCIRPWQSQWRAGGDGREWRTCTACVARRLRQQQQQRRCEAKPVQVRMAGMQCSVHPDARCSRALLSAACARVYACVRKTVLACVCALEGACLKARTSVRTGMLSRQRHTHCCPWTETRLPRLPSPRRRRWTRLTARITARERKTVRIPMLA